MFQNLILTAAIVLSVPRVCRTANSSHELCNSTEIALSQSARLSSCDASPHQLMLDCRRFPPVRPANEWAIPRIRTLASILTACDDARSRDAEAIREPFRARLHPTIVSIESSEVGFEFQFQALSVGSGFKPDWSACRST